MIFTKILGDVIPVCVLFVGERQFDWGGSRYLIYRRQIPGIITSVCDIFACGDRFDLERKR